MSTNIKNQNTLFRFVSLRSPELSRKEGKEQRFVLHPDNSSGYFFQKVNTRPSGQSIQDAMKAGATSFNAYQSITDLSAVAPAFYSVAEWIFQHKSTATPSQLLAKINEASVLASSTEITLWDNLFYQATTLNNFYVKEGIIQMLVLQNTLKQKAQTPITEANAALAVQLVNSTIVLPTNLFPVASTSASTSGGGSPISSGSSSSGTSTSPLPKEFYKALDVEAAKANVEIYQGLQEELKKVDVQLQKTYKAAYDTAYASYKESTKEILSAYNESYRTERERICGEISSGAIKSDDSPCAEVAIPYPVFPSFNPPSSDTNFNTVNGLLPEALRAKFTSLPGISNINSVKEASDILNAEIANEQAFLLKNIGETEKFAAIGGIAIPTSNTIAERVVTFPYQLCCQILPTLKVRVYMVLQVPDTSWQIQSFIYTMHTAAGINNTNGYYTETRTNNTITLQNLFNGLLPLLPYNSIDGIIKFTNGVQLSFNINPITLTGCVSGNLQGSTTTTPAQTPGGFIPSGYGIKQLGIADYKKVVSHVCCYDPGEVAHIENVMAREIKEKTTTRFTQSQITETASYESEQESLTDTTTAQRFEMQKEISKMMQEQSSTTANVGLSASKFGINFNSSFGYASNLSKEECNRLAITESKDITQRAMERIVTKTKVEKTVKITNEFTEQNKHGFDNTQSNQHVTGVYRFINAIYKNQIYNYGKRLMYEFMVPEPSRLQLLSTIDKTTPAPVIEKPVNPTNIGLSSHKVLTPENYFNWTKLYGAMVDAPKLAEIVIGASYDNAANENGQANTKSTDLTIPEDYYTYMVRMNVTGMDAPGGWDKKILVTAGNISQWFYPMRISAQPYTMVDAYTGKMPLTFSETAFLTANVNISVKCRLTAEALEKWQLKVFNAIMEAYAAMLKEYEDKLATLQATATTQATTNPLFYRQIEQDILHKNCISYLLDEYNPASPYKTGADMYAGTSFTDAHVVQNQQLDKYAGLSKFMEQAFEWNLMSYHFYPFYWGSSANWKALYNTDVADPLFRSFMQAGMARVVVTVRPGFEKAVMHYMATGQIWNGGEIPVIGDPLYLSIVDEIKEQEYVVEETWETVLPTNLVALQSSGVAIDASGLPCGDGCQDHAGTGFINNNATLGVKP